MSNAEKREKKRDHPVFEVQGFVIEKKHGDVSCLTIELP